MTLDEAIAAVEASLKKPYVRIDRRQPLEDDQFFLILVLGLGPRLVEKRTGRVTELKVTDALARARTMRLAVA